MSKYKKMETLDKSQSATEVLTNKSFQNQNLRGICGEPDVEHSLQPFTATLNNCMIIFYSNGYIKVQGTNPGKIIFQLDDLENSIPDAYPISFEFYSDLLDEYEIYCRAQASFMVSSLFNRLLTIQERKDYLESRLPALSDKYFDLYTSLIDMERILSTVIG